MRGDFSCLCQVAEQLMTIAYESGVNLFDTAEVYSGGKWVTPLICYLSHIHTAFFPLLSAVLPKGHKILAQTRPGFIHLKSPKMKGSRDSNVIYIILFITGGST